MFEFKVASSVLARAVVWCAAALCVSGAGQAHSQVVDSANAGPFRTSTVGDESNLMLEGHDAVAYFTQNAAIKGDPAIRTERE